VSRVKTGLICKILSIPNELIGSSEHNWLSLWQAYGVIHEAAAYRVVG
jgi:hypothetical protein